VRFRALGGDARCVARSNVRASLKFNLNLKTLVVGVSRRRASTRSDDARAMVFKTLWNYVKVYRAQTRALERIRAERSALEKTQREIAAMTEKNAENERALASFAKWSAGAMRENASSMEEIERVTTEMTDRLGAVSEQHVRDAYEAEARAAEAMNASRAAAVFANLDEVKGKP
jgi:hypothetical protein